MDAMISQEEIDALLRARKQLTTVLPARLNDSDLPQISGLLGQFVQGALASATANTGTPCEGLLSDVNIMTAGAVSNLGAPQVFVGTSQLAGVLAGSLYYVVPFPFGLLLVAELAKNAGPDALPKASVQAMGDFLSVMNEAGLTALGDALGTKVNGGAVSAAIAGSLAEKSLEGSDARVLSAGVDVAVGDAMGRLLLVMPESVAICLVQAVKAKAKAQQPGIVVVPAPAEAPAWAAPTPQAVAESVDQAPAAVPDLPASPAPVPAALPPAPAAQQPVVAVTTPPRNLELLKDVVLQITVELGRTTRKLKDVLTLGPGSVLELDRLANEQVDVMVNGKPIAKAEVVVVDENYGARVTQVVSPGERVRTFG